MSAAERGEATERCGVANGEMSARRVLVVDDDCDFAETLVDIIEFQGIQVSCAHSVGEVKEILGVASFDVVLLDIRLGRESGLELLAYLKKHFPDTVYVMMTAFGDVDTAVQALKRGAYDYFKKPVNGADLLATLARCFERLDLEVDKQRAQQELRERNADLASVNARLTRVLQSAKTLTASSEIEGMWGLLLGEFARNLSANAGALYEVGPRQLRLQRSVGWDEGEPEAQHALGDGDPFAKAVQSAESVLVPDISVSPLQEHWRLNENGSLLIIPLVQHDGAVVSLVSLYRFSPSPPFSPQDRELGLLLASLASEIDRSMRASRLLKESEEQFRTLVENMPGAVYRCKFDSEWTIEFVSDAIFEISGYAPAAFGEGGEMTRVGIIYPDDRQLVARAIEEGVRSKTSFVVEYRLVGADGTIHWVYEKGKALYDDEGEVRWLDGAIFDVTEFKNSEDMQRQLERQMHQVQKLESLGVLAGSIAHDFNNLLTPIIGNAEMLEEEVGPENPIYESIKEIHDAGILAKDLVYQILSFSRQADTKMGVVNVANIVHESLRLIRSFLSATIKVVEDIDDPALQVMADTTQLHQVVMNLCTNAYHAMEEEGGTLSVSVKASQVAAKDLEKCPGLQQGQRYVRIAVSDTGSGMSKEVQERIFEPFFTTKGEGKGTGIGLATVRTIVNDFHGSIFVFSEPGKGADFTVYLPEHVGVEETTTGAEEIPRGNGERILVVDDELHILQVVEPMLRSLGYAAETYVSSVEALKRFQEDPERYDLLLTDQTMPALNGDQLILEVRRLNRALPVVVASGYSYTIDPASIENATAICFVQKPFTRMELAEAIERMLQAAVATT